MLLLLPNDLLLYISGFLESQTDINAFARTGCQFFSLINRDLYLYNARKYKSSALLWTAEHGQEATAKRAIAYVMSPSRTIQAALVKASKHGNEAIVKLLLSNAGVDPNFGDLWDGPALYAAAKEDHFAIVKLLLSTGGVDPDLKKFQKVTPLWWAVSNRNEDMVKLLLSTKALILIHTVHTGSRHCHWRHRMEMRE